MGVYQFIKGSSLEAVLSLVYSTVFFIAGLVNRNNSQQTK